MLIKLTHLTPLLAAGAAAVAIAAAPTATAASLAIPTAAQPACTNGVCPNTHSSLPSGELPGNSQIDKPVRTPGGDFRGFYGGYSHGDGGAVHGGTGHR